MVAAQGPLLLPPGMSNRQGKGSKRRKIIFPTHGLPVSRCTSEHAIAKSAAAVGPIQPLVAVPGITFVQPVQAAQTDPKSSSIGSPAYATMEALLSRGIATAFTAQLQWRNGDPPVRHAVLRADEVLLMVWGYYYESSGRHRLGWRATTSVSANRREHCGQRSSCAAAAGGSAKNTK